jgi:hypothetical protein
MTPAIDLLKKAKAEHRVHSYQHDPKAPSYGLEAAEKLGLAPECLFKTLLAVTEKGELLVAVVPVVVAAGGLQAAPHSPLSSDISAMARPPATTAPTPNAISGLGLPWASLTPAGWPAGRGETSAAWVCDTIMAVAAAAIIIFWKFFMTSL